MKGKTKSTRRKTGKNSRRSDHGRFLDRIIEKYTATPTFDPDRVDYSLRPTKAQLAKEQIDQLTRFSAGA